MENFEYLIAFKMAGIAPHDGSKICSIFNDQILNRLAGKGKLDRRIIRPILEEAVTMSGGINDENVTSILDDINTITSMIAALLKIKLDNYEVIKYKKCDTVYLIKKI